MTIAVISGWVARGLVILLSLLNTKLLIELIGVEGLAAHSVIVSLTVWFALLNFGLPTSIQNLISKYRAEGLDYEHLKNTAYSALVVIFLLLLPVVLAAGVAAKYWLLAKYPFVSVNAVLVACILIFVSSLGVLFSQILYAEHRGLWPNIYPAINAVTVSLSLMLLNWLKIDDFNEVLVIFFLPALLVFSLGVYHLKAFRTWSLDVQNLREIWAGSRGFLLFATLAACTLAVDYFVMSLILQSYDIAIYNLVSRIFGTIMAIYGVLLAMVWPVMSELMHGKKLSAARKKLWRILGQGLLMGGAGGAVIIFAMDWIISILAGGKVSEVPLIFSLTYFLYILIRIWCDTFSVGSLCIGNTGPINRYVPVQAAISIIAQYYLGSVYGVLGIIYGLILSFLMTAAWVLPWQFYKLTKVKV